MAIIRKCIYSYDIPNPSPRDILASYPKGTQVVEWYKDHLNNRRVYILRVSDVWLLARQFPYDIDAQQQTMMYEET